MSANPEVVVDGFPRHCPHWIEVVTSADHKDVGRMMIVAALRRFGLFWYDFVVGLIENGEVP